jgi:DNA-binding transcriptional LysR family regulator
MVWCGPAVSAGLGVSILPEVAILPDHCLLDASDGFPPITDTEVALVTAPEASPATRRLAQARFLRRRRSAPGGVMSSVL